MLWTTRICKSHRLLPHRSPTLKATFNHCKHRFHPLPRDNPLGALAYDDANGSVII
jgi:hypothetical protein